MSRAEAGRPRFCAAGSRARATFLCALSLVLFSGCAYVPLPPLGAQLSASNLDPDEQHLWKKSRELQHEIEISGLLFEDPELQTYLDRVLTRVAASELAAASLAPKIRVISDVNFHGYSFANGVIYVHTALLSRMEDETQLATVLSRELAHVINRHALRTQRDRRIQADTLAWVGIGASLVEGGGTYKLLVQAASITSVAGFHHLLETAADAKGLSGLSEAGYDVRGTPEFFQVTLDHLAEVHSQGVWGWAPFNPPAQITNRISGYRSLIASQYSDQPPVTPPIADAREFRRKVHRATLRQADLELAAGLFLSAEASARLAIESDPRDVEARILLGRALGGQRSKPIAGKTIPSIKELREVYSDALRLRSRHPVATRELGMTYYRTMGSARSRESTTEALRLLRRYLRLSPNAEDADYIRGYISELEAESR